MTEALNDQQQRAVAARGTVFVSAGAGTGKTRVLVERFASAVVDEGLDLGSLLLITYTERAAGELRSRIHAELLRRGRPDLARELDGAWISTIHGFCRRLLMSYPLAAGIDPRFRVLDESQAAVLRGEAFTVALERFCATGEPDRWQLLATYGARELRRMLVGVYATIRAAGGELELLPAQGVAFAQRLEELRAAALTLAEDASATDAQRGATRGVLELVASTKLPESFLDLDQFAARGARAAAFVEARDAARSAALEELAARDRVLLQELLTEFASSYGVAKEREGALDFEDLQLQARELLRSDAAVRESEQLRFRSIMVDEFQDTNRLQCDLIDLLSGGGQDKDVFFVGDEFQSIYGFRHADVAVFRERRAAAPCVLPLTLNYRSRPGVLAAVNELFAAEFARDFQRLEPAGGYADARLGAPFELLVTDKSSYDGSGLHWRRAEARHVARRVRELVDSGDATPGEIVLLFAAGTDAEWFEQELQAVGLPTYRATGRRYFGQQQVVDLLSYLRLVHNRYDDEALLSVLASPFVGVSNDALVLIRAGAERRPIFKGIERSLPSDLSSEDRRLVRAFLQRYERLVDAASRVSLEALCERILVEHDYDLAVLARRDGRRRYANLRKLARLARSFQELRGNDLEGFVRFIAEQEAAGAHEVDAVSEEEGADAVRLLTIHTAKGLEFKVVVVADAGRERPRIDDILALADGRFGFRVAHPETGTRVDTASYQDVRRTRQESEEAERLRLYYVAMTRAMDRLIVSGSVNVARRTAERTPIAWVLDRLELDAELENAAVAPLELRRGEASLVLRVDRCDEEALAAVPSDAVATEERFAPGAQLALFEGTGEILPLRAPRLHALPVVPLPPLQQVRRLSFSAISLFERCSYRFYVERLAGMQAAEWAQSGEGGGGLHAAELGDAAHRLLEHLDLAAPQTPDAVEASSCVRGWYPLVTHEDLARIVDLVSAYVESTLGRRVASLEGARAERPFLFEHDGVVLNGRLDVLWSDGVRALVVDYKTNALAERTPGEIVSAEYRVQRLVYALACLRSGVEEVEVVYQFLEVPEDTISEIFTSADVPALEAELSELIARVRAGRFEPTPSEYACSGCPALDVVCAGPKLLSELRFAEVG